MGKEKRGKGEKRGTHILPVLHLRRGGLVIVLLAGGDKSPQEADIRRTLAVAKFNYGRKIAPLERCRPPEKDEDAALYLAACFDDDPGIGSLVRAALGDIAHARSMTKLARETGLTREGLYRALSADGNPEFSTVMRVIKALGLRLEARSARS